MWLFSGVSLFQPYGGAVFLSFPREAHFLEIEGDFVAQAAAERQTEEDIKVALRSVIVRSDDDVGLRRDADGNHAGFRYG